MMKRMWDWLSLAAERAREWRAGAEPGDLVRLVQAEVFQSDAEFQQWHKPAGADCGNAAKSPALPGSAKSSNTSGGGGSGGAGALVDYLFTTPEVAHEPQEVFPRLRWGGQLVFVSPDGAEVADLASKYRDRRGFVLEREPARVCPRRLGLRMPFLSRPAHYFAARKVLLVQPGQMTDRFTYDVRLIKAPPEHGGHAVLKQIPEFDAVVARLHERLPEATMDVILKGARKLVDKVFPVFLTREAAFLSILKRDLPAPYNERVPKIIDLQKDGNGFVKRLYLQWLRNGGEPLTQMQFARQSAELLRVLHEHAGVIHLDLRLDNFVITRKGVGFVDFGSAVRVGEDLNQNPMLRTLFAEMMTTSQIQRDLGKMVRRGKVTSRMLVDSHQRVDKAVDLFYLALQMSDPHGNPDFADLIRYDPQSPEARRLAQLTHEILKPLDPENPPYQSAADIVAALELIQATMGKKEEVAA